MSSAAISFIVLASVFGGALAGLLLRRSLRQDHISPDSKDTVKLSMALVSTMSALVLGLLVSSAKTFYDTQSAELNQMSADVVALDRLLAHYGPETKEAREQLRVAVIRNLDRIWPQERTRSSEEPASGMPGESILDEIQALSPKAKIVPGFRLYDLRHTYASRAVMAGVDLPTLAALLGHTSVQMTMRYVHPAEEHKREAAAKIEKFKMASAIELASRSQGVTTKVTTVERVQ